MASRLVKRIFLISCLAVVLYAFPSIDGDGAASYLNKFGYLGETTHKETLNIRDHEAKLTAIKDSEELAALSEKGELNNGTVEMMNVSRCDVKTKTGDCVRNKRSVRADYPDFCDVIALDTITQLENGDTYLFKGNLYWKLFPGGVPEGYPRTISGNWDGLPGNLDASFTDYKGDTYFFKGPQFWKFFNKQKDPDYPKQLSTSSLKDIPENMDAIIGSIDDKSGIYVFRGTEYWHFNFEADKPIQGYPKQIGEGWDSLISDGIDAAVLWQDKEVYFFKDNLYYKYNYTTKKVIQERDPYPRASRRAWFGC